MVIELEGGADPGALQFRIFSIANDDKCVVSVDVFDSPLFKLWATEQAGVVQAYHTHRLIGATG